MKECTAFGYQSSMRDSLSLESDDVLVADDSVSFTSGAESVAGVLVPVFPHPLTISIRVIRRRGSRE
jgi:hypothetical protein